MSGCRCRLVVTVDGPTASGKTTLARRIAEIYGLPFLDTGLLYRAVARRLLAAGRPVEDEAAAVAAARSLTPADLERPDLHAEEVSQAASRVAAIPAVRAALLDWQRAFAARPEGAVLAGRDTGTVVVPEAPVKLFVTASVEARARRRFRQLRARGERPIFARVLEELEARDRRDTERAVAPLRPAPDALVLDTTDEDVETTVAVVRRHIEAWRVRASCSSHAPREDGVQPQPRSRRASSTGTSMEYE